jgi:hypothetical protein
MSSCCDPRESGTPSAGVNLVCYCFGESEASIRQEIETDGRSSAVARIRGHIAAGRCACEVKNPRGVCCLGDLIAAVRRAELALAEPAAPALSADIIDGSQARAG